MRAAQLVAFGDPPEFDVREVAEPEAGPTEAVVALEAAALNRRDWWIWRQPGRADLPVTLGSDGAGIVAAVGEDVVDFVVGDEVVFDATLNWGGRDDCPGPEFAILGVPNAGTFAESVVVPARNLAHKPPRLSWEEAAALNLAGLTAWRAAVTCAGAAPGRTLLVTGAGGGVSTFAVQIAAALGTRVLVTSGGEEKIDRALALGADAGFDYRDPRWPDALVEATDGGVDAVVDGYGAPTWRGALRALRDGGVLVNFGDTGGADARVDVMEVYWHWRSIVGTTMGSPREYGALLDHVRDASWRPVVDSGFPLEDIA
ncbi:MAG: zinc-binding dehydrogenase, partial [Actinomycetota bacterium]|nr:zinc-binding dehydrogenase [Actinomycetota bacterium]